MVLEFLCQNAGIVRLKKCAELNGELAGYAGLDLFVGVAGCGRRRLVFLDRGPIRIDRGIVVAFNCGLILLSNRWSLNN